MAKYYVNIGGAVGDVGEIKYGFHAPDDAYDGIADELGVVKLTDNASARGVAFGINSPKPPRVRLSGEVPELGDNERGSCVRFCDPDKVGRVLNGSLNDATVKSGARTIRINQVSMAS